MTEFISKSEAKRIWSLRWAIFTAIASAIPLAYATMPTDWQETIPAWAKVVFTSIVMFGAAGTAVSRVIKQGPPK